MEEESILQAVLHIATLKAAITHLYQYQMSKSPESWSTTEHFSWNFRQVEQNGFLLMAYLFLMLVIVTFCISHLNSQCNNEKHLLYR